VKTKEWYSESCNFETSLILNDRIAISEMPTIERAPSTP